MRQPRRSLRRQDLRNLVVYVVSFAALYGGFLLFRWTYFGELLPNTFYAKGGPSLRAIVALLTLQTDMIVKALDLMASVASRTLSGLAALALLAVTLYLMLARRFGRLSPGGLDYPNWISGHIPPASGRRHGRVSVRHQFCVVRLSLRRYGGLGTAGRAASDAAHARASLLPA